MNTPRTALSSNAKILIEVEFPFPWPIGAQNLVHSEISLPDDSKENIYVWIHQPREQKEDAKDTDPVDVRLFFNKDRYMCDVVMAEKISIIIEDKKIVKIQDKSPPYFNNISENYFDISNWNAEDVYLMSYLASMGVPPFKFEWTYTVDLPAYEWSPEILQLMIKLVDSGHVVDLYGLGIDAEFWTPEAVMAAGPLLSIVTEGIRMRGIDLNMAQWQEMERMVSKNPWYFTLEDCTVDQYSSECVANIMANVKEASLDNVKFKDIQKFYVCFEAKDVEDLGVRCEKLSFGYDEEEDYKKYVDEIKSMGERLGWKDLDGKTPDYNDNNITRPFFMTNIPFRDWVIRLKRK